MSLIDEALKRARQEATRQDAAEREARYARVPAYVAPSRRPRPWLLPVVVSACLAAGVAGGVVISRHPGPAAAPANRTASEAPANPAAKPPEGPHPLAPSPATPPALPGRGGTFAAGVEDKKPVAEKTAEEPVIEEQSESRSPSPGEGDRGGGRGGQGVRASIPPPQKVPAPAADPAPAPEPPQPSPPSPVIALPQPAPTPAPEPAPAAPAPLTETRSYVREVPVPGGGTLRLNGIAFSAAQPVALFGDKVVAPGESVNGFTVVTIEAQRVKLQGPGGTVYVTLK